ncbi:hypothetical protein GCM10008171_19590 [Methylopila jiangsuensis]|uniref:DUF3168 domain-containing protein n=1 Tax=Methylopila jiangsuensis TaxID=586230 RepID=A0A9W6N3V2_9HYPH|nr:DUF3168 domain-containing protein [Methylopila jiangsuensis]MDR6286945.1 hypothetical protein [Methylopila jiangsuensis]GLK76705.1 hypothetical protein GCM10008171_19590 [Methylopila jiangsuensis]
MTEPSLALQKAVFDRLRADAGVTALVPAANIFDRHGLPTVSPCIILGDDQTIRDPLSLADNSYRVAVTLHLWVKGQNLVLAKQISGAVMVAMRPGFWTPAGFEVAWLSLDDARYMRDPGGEWGHAVLTFEAMLVEVVA